MSIWTDREVRRAAINEEISEIKDVAQTCDL